MMKNNCLMVYISLGMLAIAFAQNYCDPALCTSGTHIGCNHSGKLHSRCVDGRMVTLTAAQKQLLLDVHNEQRNIIAGGDVKKLKPACRMPTMKWDDELAKLATLNTLACKMEHDQCRNTAKFKYSGQNIAILLYFGTPNATEKLLNGVELWYREVKDTYQEQIDAFPMSYPYVIGHFTGMVGDLNTHVGCGVTTYKTLEPGREWYEFLLTCNYANTNILTLPIYKSCAKAGTECKTGKHTTYKNLCNVTEVVDANNIWRQ